MTTQTGRRRALIVLVALTLCFIWGNSLLPGEVSGAISNWVGELLRNLFPGAITPPEGHGTLRKLAHGTEYLILGIELTLLLRRAYRMPVSALALSGVATALVDETIQLFTPARAGQIRDVWIDLGGFCAGCLLCMAIRRLRKNQR